MADVSDEGNSEEKTDPKTALTGRARSLANLRPPWKKGEVANPKGRPKSLARQIAEWENENGKSIERLFFEAAMGLTGSPFKKGSREHLEAMKWLGERKLGKAPDLVVNVDATEAAASAMAELDRQDLVALARQATPPTLASLTSGLDDGSHDGEGPVVDAIPSEPEDPSA